MGACPEIANPIACVREENFRASPAAFPEQGVGSGAMGGGFVLVRGNPGDFRFEQGNPLVQFP
jgi:hypothetical protein